MIDKTKAYRFRGDSERWEWVPNNTWLLNKAMQLVMIPATAEHLHSRGILIEYPELPGDDWEFCGAKDQEMYWVCYQKIWLPSRLHNPTSTQIYCRKKKPAYRSGVIKGRQEETIATNGEAIYWTTDPERGKELLK